MSFSKHPEYKDSGVEWLGQVPNHWHIRKGRWLFEIKKRIVGELGFDVLSITQKGIRVKDTESNDGQLSMDYSKYQLVEIGDFAMNHMDLLTGYVDLSPIIGVTSPDYRVFTIKDAKSCHPKFFLCLLQNGYLNKIFYPYGQGSSQLGRWRMPTEQFKDFSYPFPPIDEQKKIVTFISVETAKIDILVAEQEKLIELLKERRQAVISHAVTKGLDPTVKMKNSGVEWLEEVPEHWDVKKLKFLVDVMASNVDKKSYEGEISCSLCNYTDVYYNENICQDMEFMSATATAEQVVKFTLKKDDVVITKDSESPNDIGIAAYVPFDLDGVVCGYHLSIVRPHSINGMFVKRLFDSNYLKSKFAVLANGLTRYGLGQYSINNVYIPIPPELDQLKIINLINKTCLGIDDLIDKSKDSINLLLERRSALISEAVTGQIDVRNYKLKEAA